MSTVVVLREVEEADLPIFYEQQLDPVATAMAAFPARSEERFMAHWARIRQDRTNVTRTIVWQGEVAGNIVCFHDQGEWMIGYWLGRAYWGKGIMTAALSAFLGEVEVRPLFAHVVQHNIASRRVLEKCGFVVIGESEEFAAYDSEPVAEYILRLSADEGV